MDYKDLDINQRINLKGMLVAFQRIAVKDWQKKIEKNVYRKRGTLITTRDGYAANRIRIRTGALRRDWQTSLIQTAAGLSTARFEFPLHGRFNDMGVGKGVSFTDQQYGRSRYGRRLGDAPGRKPTRWYSKTKAYSQKKLSELLAKRYGIGLVQFVENQLTFRVGINL